MFRSDCSESSAFGQGSAIGQSFRHRNGGSAEQSGGLPDAIADHATTDDENIVAFGHPRLLRSVQGNCEGLDNRPLRQVESPQWHHSRGGYDNCVGKGTRYVGSHSDELDPGTAILNRVSAFSGAGQDGIEGHRLANLEMLDSWSYLLNPATRLVAHDHAGNTPTGLTRVTMKVRAANSCVGDAQSYFTRTNLRLRALFDVKLVWTVENEHPSSEVHGISAVGGCNAKEV